MMIGLRLRVESRQQKARQPGDFERRRKLSLSHLIGSQRGLERTTQSLFSPSPSPRVFPQRNSERARAWDDDDAPSFWCFSGLLSRFRNRMVTQRQQA